MRSTVRFTYYFNYARFFAGFFFDALIPVRLSCQV